MDTKIESVPFEQLFSTPLRNGLTRPKAVRGNGVKMINMGELFAHSRIGNVHMARVPFSENEQGYLLQEGDLLFARQSLVLAGAGKCSIFAGASEPVTYEGHIIRARLNAEIASPFFYYYFFNSPIGRQVIESIVEQVAAAGIRGSDLAKLKVPHPLISEQRAIAEVLGSLDDKIELNRRMNDTLESMARAVFRQWFVDGQDAKGWKVGTVGDDFNLTMGQSPPGETYNEDKVGMPFFQGRTDFGFRFPTNRIYCSAPTRFAKPGDTLVSVRAPVGDINLAAEKCAVGRGVAAIRHKTGSRSYTYYSMHLLEDEFNRFEAEGTVFGSINKADFQALKVKIPPPEKILKFEEICYPIDQQIENNEKQSRTLAALRDALLPRLMSGEVRVRRK
ncbi:restriction endonuclease subunit S [bacterium]|nr:MAG: restriction endonuclease subunit S [bacterium]